MNALAAALRGDDVLFAAIEAADPDTFGISCECGVYYIGKFTEMDPADACCPECGSTRGCGDTPALGKGPAAARKG